jgi:hypothetical protein
MINLPLGQIEIDCDTRRASEFDVAASTSKKAGEPSFGGLELPDRVFALRQSELELKSDCEALIVTVCPKQGEAGCVVGCC